MGWTDHPSKHRPRGSERRQEPPWQNILFSVKRPSVVLTFGGERRGFTYALTIRMLCCNVKRVFRVSSWPERRNLAPSASDGRTARIRCLALGRGLGDTLPAANTATPPGDHSLCSPPEICANPKSPSHF